MFKRLLNLVLYFIFILLVGLITAPPSYALPSGFKKVSLAENLAQPTALVQTPDGRIFLAEQGGNIKVFKDSTILPTPLLTLPVDSEGERGLLGMALDPSFAANGYLYIYYVNGDPLEIRVSRFTVQGDKSSTGSEVVLFRSTGTIGLLHKAGTVRVGPDGKLWFSIGDNGTSTNAQNLSNIHGKILRINKDGSIPNDNPFVGRAGAKAEIWAYGFRNPFRFQFGPDGKLYVGDVGNAKTEEINLVTKGGNYGWPQSEGPCTGCPYINPFFSYETNGGTGYDAAVVGGLVYTSNSGSVKFPASYNGSYFYGDYPRSYIRRIQLDTKGNFVSDNSFDDEAGTVVDLLQGKNGSIYYVTIFPGGLFEIRYSPENLAPSVKISATPTGGKAPLAVNFSSAGSEDPEGQQLTYQWAFGDGATSTLANPTHTYTVNGIYTATLTVSDGVNQSSVISFPIYVGNELPNVRILEPQENQKYNADQVITFQGDATDPEDGTLPASSFSWTVVFHHENHIHPFLGPVQGQKNGTLTIPDTGEESAETYYELILSATDSKGQKQTATRIIRPNVITLRFAGSPEDSLNFTLDGAPLQTPYTTQGVVGFKRTLSVDSRQSKNGYTYDFLSWSDNGLKTHTLTTPNVNTTYTSTFKKAVAGLGNIRFRVREFDNNGVWTGRYLNGATAKLADPTGTTLYETSTSARIGDEDGWVQFTAIDAGTYSVLTYKEGYAGIWRQTDCTTGGTTQNATVRTSLTGEFIAAWQPNIEVRNDETALCKDVGLERKNLARLHFRVRLIEKNPRPDNSLSFINGATTKITDQTGQIVLQTTTSAAANGDDGWALFDNVPEGTYGVLAYKEGYVGFWKQTNCDTGFAVGASLKNQHTAGLTAAFKNEVPVIGGITNYCHDLGLKGFGKIHFRVREFDNNGRFTGKFINGATAKLADPTGTTIYAEAISHRINDQDGWVEFDNVEAGYYATIVYKNEMQGGWKQTNCTTGSTTDEASITNANTNGKTASFQNDVHITPQQTTWCKDLGLSTNTQTGNIHFRVREFDARGRFTGKFLNDVTAKLLDSSSTNLVAVATSAAVQGNDGWVYFDDVSSGDYSVLAFIDGKTGFWRQTDCGAGGTTDTATYQSNTTEGNVAAYQASVAVLEGKTTWCKDVGLKAL